MVRADIFTTQLIAPHNGITTYFRIVSILCCTATYAATIVGWGHACWEAAIIVTRMGIPPAGRDCAPGPDGERSALSGKVFSTSAAWCDRFGGCR